MCNPAGLLVCRGRFSGEESEQLEFSSFPASHAGHQCYMCVRAVYVERQWLHTIHQKTANTQGYPLVIRFIPA